MVNIAKEQLLDVFLVIEGYGGAGQEEGCQVQGSQGQQARAALPGPQHLVHQPVQGPLFPMQCTPAPHLTSRSHSACAVQH